jgi:hypothetical protein
MRKARCGANCTKILRWAEKGRVIPRNNGVAAHSNRRGKVNKTIDIECPKCKQPMRVHPPQLCMGHDSRLSQVVLIPSWSTDERECPKCKHLVAPIITKIETGYAAYAPAEPAGPRLIHPVSDAEIAALRQAGGRG